MICTFPPIFTEVMLVLSLKAPASICVTSYDLLLYLILSGMLTVGPANVLLLPTMA